MPKGNAKTELCAHIGLAELMGPLAPTSPNVVVSAASWKQANKILGAARAGIEGDLATKSGPLRPFFRPAVHLLDDRILHPDRPGMLQRIAAVGGTNDGGLPTVHIGDEIHEWEGEDRERVYIVQGKSLRKRAVPRPHGLQGALQIGITTAGETKDSLLGVLYEHGVAVAKGEIDDPTFLILWWEADPAWDLDLEEELVQAILEGNPAVGEFLPLENKVASFRDPTVKRHEFERYDLDRWVSSPRRWIPEVDVEATRDRERGLPPDKTPIVLSFDGSYNRDCSSLKGCTLDGYIFRVQVWEPTALQPVPRGEVDAEVAKAMARWKVVEFAVDPPGWTTEVEAWEAEWPGIVLRFETNQPVRMGPACDRFRGALLESARAAPKDRTLTHDGHPTFERHIGNCETRGTRYGDLIVKEHPDSPKRIDDAVAGVIAYERAMNRPALTRKFHGAFV